MQATSLFLFVMARASYSQVGLEYNQIASERLENLDNQGLFQPEDKLVLEESDVAVGSDFETEVLNFVPVVYRINK